MQVAQLRHEEPVRLNADRLEAIFREHGEERGEVAICEAMEDLAVMLAAIEAAWRKGESENLCRLAQAVADVAARVGMPDVVRIAQDILELVGRQDDAALASVVARLGRLGQGSLLAVWDAQVPFG